MELTARSHEMKGCPLHFDQPQAAVSIYHGGPRLATFSILLTILSKLQRMYRNRCCIAQRNNKSSWIISTSLLVIQPLQSSGPSHPRPALRHHWRWELALLLIDQHHHRQSLADPSLHPRNRLTWPRVFDVEMDLCVRRARHLLIRPAPETVSCV